MRAAGGCHYGPHLRHCGQHSPQHGRHGRPRAQIHTLALIAPQQTAYEWRKLAQRASAHVVEFQAQHMCCGLGNFEEHGVGDCVMAAAAVPQRGCARALAADSKSWLVTAWLVSLGAQLLVAAVHIAVRRSLFQRAVNTLLQEAQERQARQERRRGARSAAVAVAVTEESMTPGDSLEQYAQREAARIIQRAYLWHLLRVKVRPACARSCVPALISRLAFVDRATGRVPALVPAALGTRCAAAHVRHCNGVTSTPPSLTALRCRSYRCVGRLWHAGAVQRVLGLPQPAVW